MNRGDASPSAKTDTSYPSGTTSSREAARSDIDAHAHRPLDDGAQDDDQRDRDQAATIANRPRLRIRLIEVPLRQRA